MEAEESETNELQALGLEDLSPNFSLSPPTPVSPDYHIQENDDISGHNGNLCDEGLTLGPNSPNEQVGNISYWKQRYEVLDGQLRTFRQQALKIRHVLATRVRILSYDNFFITSACYLQDEKGSPRLC